MMLRALLVAASLAALPLHARAACPPAGTPRDVIAASLGAVRLGGDRVSVRLAPVCGPDGRSLDLRRRLAAQPERRVLLVIEDLRAARQPGVLYELRLGGARLGTLNFYAAQPPGIEARARRVSYDATAVVRRLAAEHALGDGATLQIHPLGPLTPDAEAGIGRILLIAQ